MVSFRVFWCALGIGLATSGQTRAGDVTPTGVAIDSSPTEVIAAQRVSIARSRAIAGSTPVCGAAADCNDGLPCTQDICVEGDCRHLPIPDCVPCEPAYEQCSPVDIVFVMDTSGSMRDEAAALCDSMSRVVDELSAEGFDVAPAFLGITQSPGYEFGCLLNTVVDSYGGVVPGASQSCPFPNGSSPHESWGPATAIVAQNYLWRTGSARIIVPISDEGPCNGSRPEGCNDPGDDRDSITNAANVALANQVVVSPIAGTGSDACVINLGSAIATATGGTLFQTKDPKIDFKDALIRIIHQTCTPLDTCDDRNECTTNDRCRDGVCGGTTIPNCRVCAAAADCNDADLCTTDTCVDRRCLWTPSYDVGAECCNPTTGGSLLIDDGDPCTADECDPSNGAVSHPPAEAGVECDDGRVCTYSDACNGAGLCSGMDVNTRACSSNADCLGLGNCDVDRRLCNCSEQPRLCLEIANAPVPLGTCYSAGSDFDINVELFKNASTIIGGQFSIQYDPTVLTLLGISPGRQSDPSSPFELELAKQVDAIHGTVFYLVSVALGQGGTRGPATMATLHFRSADRCVSMDGLCFTEGVNPPNRLVDDKGRNVAFESCCSAPMSFSLGEPVLTCPSSVTRNADAGRLAATVNWSAPTASSPCGGPVQLVCTGTDTRGFPINSLIQTGGIFSVGVSSFHCSAIDSCGSEASCDWNVQVSPESTMIVNLELSAPITIGPLLRCIEFELYSSCLFAPEVVRQTVQFGGLFNFPGHASNLVLKVPAGQARYLCATARDPLHTLRSASSVTIVDKKYVASFVGDPKLGGNWMIGGNLDGDRVIDTLDYATLLAQYQAHVDPFTNCEVEGPHADFNGDGLVDLSDLAFIERNFLKNDKTACCAINTSAGDSAGIEEITLEELSAMGYGDLSAADVNGDGVINRDDATLLLRRESARMKVQTPRTNGTAGDR